MSDRIPMTVYGKQKLEQELKKLKSEKRPEVIEAISEARAHGDLKENAEYHAAREQQSFVEGRIQEIEAKLSQAQVIDVKQMPESDKVIFGCTVELFNIDTEETLTYQIVGDDEADLSQNKISFQAPIAKALIGKHEGDEMTFKSPDGREQHFEITEVRYE